MFFPLPVTCLPAPQELVVDPIPKRRRQILQNTFDAFKILILSDRETTTRRLPVKLFNIKRRPHCLFPFLSPLCLITNFFDLTFVIFSHDYCQNYAFLLHKIPRSDPYASVLRRNCMLQDTMPVNNHYCWVVLCSSYSKSCRLFSHQNSDT